MEGFDLFWKYMAKHHPSPYFSNLDMEATEKEILEDRQTAEGVGEVATIDGATIDPSSSNTV